MTRNRSILLLFLLACVVLPIGYMMFNSRSGCTVMTDQTDEEREKTEAEKRKAEEEEKEKEKLPFEPLQVTILPGMTPAISEEDDIETVDGTQDPEDPIDGTQILIDGADQRGPRRVAAKPGHWVHARYQTKANDFDFSGQLTVECVDGSLNPIDLDRSPYRSSTSRPVVFPKGQYKSVELPVFISPRRDSPKKAVQLHAKVLRRGGRLETQDFTPAPRLQGHQYHLVVLADDPDAYLHLRDRDAIKPPRGSEMDTGARTGEDYIVTLHGLGENESLLLPGNPLAWTSIACVMWDEIPPDALAPDQQQALLDWLHWGGQIIMSGPRSLDPLRASFLAEYLPATSGKTETATPEMMAELNQNWSLNPVATEIVRSKYRLVSTEKRPLELTPLTPTEGSTVVPKTGGLVVERQVGRGRIVVTAFSLSDRSVVNWQNFDGFLNGCLLRRPARKFGFANPRERLDPFVTMPGLSQGLSRKDPRINCGLRYFTRDAMVRGEGRAVAQPYRYRRPVPQPNTRNNTRNNQNGNQDTAEANPQDATPELVRNETKERRDARELQDVIVSSANETEADAESEAEAVKLRSKLEARLANSWGMKWKPGSELSNRLGLNGYESGGDSGIGGWSDFSPASSKARMSLQEAAGISVPTAGFVAKVLAGYLICLVPVNWLLFRLLRRVEWAWFAAPLIAIAGAVCVVRLAQLDIGFVRSRTEIAILEMQPGYDRGHLTRYCGMYTSLTSDYAVEFEDSNAVGLPFSTDPSPEQLQLQKQKGRAVPFVRDAKVALSGYPVLSNSTGMVHVEQMVDLPGQFKFEQNDGQTPTLKNGTDWEVKGAIAMHLTKSGVRLIPLGDLAPGDKVDLPASASQPSTQIEDMRRLFEQLQSDPATAAVGETEGVVNLRELVRLGLEPASMRLGAWRVVGWTDQEVPGMEMTPVSNQNLYRTLLVCHLDHGDYLEPQVDGNHSVDFPREDEFGDDYDDEDGDEDTDEGEDEDAELDSL